VLPPRVLVTASGFDCIAAEARHAKCHSVFLLERINTYFLSYLYRQSEAATDPTLAWDAIRCAGDAAGEV
jgi:hypothetical protein